LKPNEKIVQELKFSMEFFSGKIPTILEINSGKIPLYLIHRFSANILLKVTIFETKINQSKLFVFLSLR
jgi:hypothetical protein